MAETNPSPNTAILLLAGLGDRLRPFTDESPKCFATVGGRRILDNALAALAGSGCQQAILVVGHLAHRIQQHIGERVHGMVIRYVVAERYATTNNIVSLSLGLDAAPEGAVWVLEGDVFFDPALLSLPGGGDIDWFVDSQFRDAGGCYLSVGRGDDHRIVSIRIQRDLRKVETQDGKSVGILRVSAATVPRLRRWLAERIASGDEQIYYDLVLADKVGDIRIQAVDAAGHRWHEIDDASDLARAEELFA